MRAGGSAWLERSADNRKVESSNLSRPTNSMHACGVNLKSSEVQQPLNLDKIFYTTDAGNILSTEFTIEVAEVYRIGTAEEIESIIQKVNHGPIELTHKESRD